MVTAVAFVYYGAIVFLDSGAAAIPVVIETFDAVVRHGNTATVVTTTAAATTITPGIHNSASRRAQYCDFVLLSNKK